MKSGDFQIEGNLVDVPGRRVYPARVEVAGGRIDRIVEQRRELSTYLLPGFVDAHVHVESSMLPPAEFARAAVVHGTVATVSDPHEIANVLGVEGVRFMLADAAASPLKFCFGAPSCVPATGFETAGDCLDEQQVAELLDDPRIGYLSEMMNVPGVLAGDAQVMAKIRAAHTRGKPVDGHAPGLSGGDAKAYFAAGVSTDHECVTKEEALDRLKCGSKVLIREGSAARNFDALYSLVDEYPGQCMFCSDDLHPDDLQRGHINLLAARSLERGLDLFHVLRAACLAPVEHYGMDVGQLCPGDPADFIEVEDLRQFRVKRAFIDGQLVAEAGKTLLPRHESKPINRFVAKEKAPADFRVPAASTPLPVIEVLDGQLITRRRMMEAKITGGETVADPARDLLKITVDNRYRNAPPASAFVHGFGFRRGAIASSVAHDSHNVIAVGASDAELCRAVNAVITARGGLAVADGETSDVLPLPIAGLMSTGAFEQVASDYARLDQTAHALGSPLRAPFMTLSFLALLVIPEIKLSDQGLFDARRMEFIPLFQEA